MNKLLRAGFRRLRKNRLYYAGLLFAAGIPVAALLSRYMDMKKYPDVYGSLGTEYAFVDVLAFYLVMDLVFAMAIVTSMFLGTEYADGTIRNKIIAGHARICVYISNYIVSAVANLSLLLVNYLVIFGIGRWIFSYSSSVPTGHILQGCLCQSVTVLGFTAILVLIAMLVPNKAGASVAALVLTIGLFFAALAVSNALLQPEYSNGTVIRKDEAGNLYQEAVLEKNPKYLTGTKRVVFEQLDVLLPLNQIVRVADGRASGNLGIMEGYSVLTVLLFGGFGIWAFRKKDLK